MKITNKPLLLLFLLSQGLFTQGTFAQKTGKAENLIIVSVDGLRWHELFKGAEKELLMNKKFNSQDSVERMHKYWSDDVQQRKNNLMPFVWNTIVKSGQIYGNRDLGNMVNLKTPYWLSYPGRSENLTGYADPKIKSNDHPNNENKNILEFLDQQQGFKGKVVSFASWDALGRIINRDRNKLLVNIPGEDIKGNNLTESEKLANEIQHYEPQLWGNTERMDATTYALAKSYIMAKHPKVVYLDLADTDVFGHDDKYDFYLDAIRNVDAMIGSLWNSLQKDSFYKGKTTLVLVTDHGRGEGNRWTSHGSSVPHANDTWMMVMGPGVKPLGELKTAGQIYQNQFAKTIVKLMGFNFTSVNPIGETIESVVK